MTRVSITRKINVRDPSANLPASGAAKLIAASGAHQSVRPAEMTSSQFDYALFGSFGSGVFNPHYSTKGAWVLACSGGHDHPSFFGAVVFDLDTDSWAYLPNANGVSDKPTSVLESETTGTPFWEMIGTQVPAPPHPYKNLSIISPANGGGPKGSMVWVGRGAVTKVNPVDPRYAHAFDLSTRIWSRKSTNAAAYGGVEQAVVYDSVTNRYYVLPIQLHSYPYLAYLDGADWTFKNTANYSYPPSANGYIRAWIHEGGGKRVLMYWRGAQILGLDLDAISSGWTVLTSNFTGTHPTQSVNDVAYHAAQGVYYIREDGATQDLHKLTPPVGDPLAGTWAITTVTLTGDTVPAYQPRSDIVTSAYRSLFYIPAYQMLGWVTAGGVALLNP